MTTCNQCGAQNKDTSKFCAKCGFLLKAPDTAVPAAYPQQPAQTPEAPASYFQHAGTVSAQVEKTPAADLQQPVQTPEVPDLQQPVQTAAGKTRKTGIIVTLAVIGALLIAAAVIFLPKLFAGNAPAGNAPAGQIDGSDAQIGNIPVFAEDNVQRELTLSTDYADGRAWIRYETDGKSYYGSIDKDGREIFRISGSDIFSVENFYEDFAYLTNTDGSLSVIDKSGKIHYTLTEASAGEVLSYGGGYALCTHHESSFDTSEDVYEVYSPDGSVQRIDFGGYYGTSGYWGNGMFAIELRDGWDWPICIYHAPTNRWIVDRDHALDATSDVRFDSGCVCPGIDYFEPEETGYRSALIVVTENGSVKNIPLSFGLNWSYYGCGAHDGVVLLYESYDGEIYSYDLETGQHYQLDEKYASRLDESVKHVPACVCFENKHYGFCNGRIVMPMTGDDGKQYLAIFDKQWNMTMERTEYDRLVGFDGNRLVMEKDGKLAVYDANGKQLFTASQLGVSSISAYADGVAYIGTGKYIDEDGNLLFDRITYLPAD